MNIIEKIKDEKVRHIKRIEDLRSMIDGEYSDYERKIENLLKELEKEREAGNVDLSKINPLPLEEGHLMSEEARNRINSQLKEMDTRSDNSIPGYLESHGSVPSPEELDKLISGGPVEYNQDPDLFDSGRAR